MKISNISKITTAIFLFTVFCYGESVYSQPPIPICTVSNNVLIIDGANVEKKPSSASDSQSSISTSASSSVSSSSANFPELDRAQADKIIYQLAILKLKPILKVKICNWKIKRKELFQEILKELLDGIEMAAELDEIEISNIDGLIDLRLDTEGIGKFLRSMGLIQIPIENTDNNSLHYKRGIYLRNNILVIDGKNFDDILKLIETTITCAKNDNGILRFSEKITGDISVFLDNFVQRISGLELRNLKLKDDIAIRFLGAIYTRLGANLTSINIHNVEIAEGMAQAIVDFIELLSGRLTSVRYFGNHAVSESDHLNIIRALGQRASLHTLDVSQNILSVGLVELLQEIMPCNTDIAQVYLSRNAVKESEIELLRFCNKPESRFLNFVDAGIREFDFVNEPRVDETLRTIQERNFAIWRLLAKPKANLSNFRDKFFKSEAELVAAILRKDGSLSTLPISEENKMLGVENLNLIAAIRGTHARLNSILDQLLAPRSSLSSDAKNTYLILSQLLLNSPTTSSSASSTSSSSSSQSELPSVTIDNNNINSTSSQWSLSSTTTSSSTSSTSSSSSSQSELPSVIIDNNNILHIDGYNSDLPDNIQVTQIIYLLNSIDSRPILGVEIQNLRLTDSSFLLEVLHTLLDNNRSAVAELSTLNIDCFSVVPNNYQLIAEIVKLLESFGFVLEKLNSDGLSHITIHSQRYLYLRNNVLIIDGANISNQILTGSLVEVVENFLNKNNYLVSGLVLQNWELNDNSIGSLFDAIMKRVDKNFSSISILDIKEVERASDFAGSLSRLIAAVKDSLKTIRYRRNNLQSEDNLRIIRSLNEYTTLHTLDFGQSNISAEMAALLRGVIERNRKLLQIYLPQCVFNEAGVLEFHRSYRFLLPTETVLYFDGITIVGGGDSTNIANTKNVAIGSLAIMQQRNIALRELLVKLLATYNHSEVIDREVLIDAIVYGSEDKILSAMGAKVRMLDNMYYAAVTLIRKLQLDLRKLQAQPDNMPAVDPIYPAPSAARVKKMEQNKPRISLLACNGRATSNNNSREEGVASNSAHVVLSATPGVPAAASKSVTEKSCSKK